jgi:endonuclease/exonuclease/phosphatase family metal-dependent hydrolase
MSYNIHKGIGGRDRRCRLERIIGVIEGENPDLVCLQEVARDWPRAGSHNQARKLADDLRMSASRYQCNVRYKVGSYGNVILSRWPLVDSHQVSLRLRNRKPRGAQLAIVRTPEGPLHLVNLHLGLADAERHWQMRHLLMHHLFRESLDYPTLIAGDFNDWRDTLRHGELANHGFALITHPPSRFRTFPAWLPVGSLDKAFTIGNMEVRHAYVVRNDLAHGASDHLPLVIDFHLPGGAAGPSDGQTVAGQATSGP